MSLVQITDPGQILVITCMDKRLAKIIKAHPTQYGCIDFDSCYVIRIAGGVRRFLVNEEIFHSNVDQMALAVKHGLKKIILLNHRDCADYKGRTGVYFESREYEEMYHRSQLFAAKESIWKLNVFCDLQIETDFIEIPAT